MKPETKEELLKEKERLREKKRRKNREGVRRYMAHQRSTPAGLKGLRAYWRKQSLKYYGKNREKCNRSVLEYYYKNLRGTPEFKKKRRLYAREYYHRKKSEGGRK